MRRAAVFKWRPGGEVRDNENKDTAGTNEKDPSSSNDREKCAK